VSFAFGGQLVQLEIQATLAPQPSPKVEMVKALLISYLVVIVVYYCVGCAGFAAFGW
jgi:amino acid permease